MKLVYLEIVQEMPKGIKRDVMGALMGHVGGEKRIVRRELVSRLMRLPEYRAKSLVRLDRMIRLTIAELQEDGYPICSDSGVGGYWLAGSKAEIEGMCREIEGRAEKLREKALCLRKAQRLVWQEDGEVMQMRMEGV